MASVHTPATYLVKHAAYRVPAAHIDKHWERLIGLPPADPIAQQMLMLREYELNFGILNPKVNKSPVTLATMNEATDKLSGSLMEATILKLVRLKLHKATGLTIPELLDLPTYELQMYVDSVIEAKRLEDLERSDVARKAGRGKQDDFLKGYDMDLDDLGS